MRRGLRVAAIYDIHGNLPALEAVLQDVRRADVDHILVGGDVLPGPMPRSLPPATSCARNRRLKPSKPSPGSN